MAQEAQAMEDLGPAAVVVAGAVVEATAEAAVIPQEEAEDLHATLPATADPDLVHKHHSSSDLFVEPHVVHSFPLLSTVFHLLFFLKIPTVLLELAEVLNCILV